MELTEAQINMMEIVADNKIFDANIETEKRINTLTILVVVGIVTSLLFTVVYTSRNYSAQNSKKS